ncbi:hypothetical protein SNE40_020154 [Patella caerulea]|uniref:Uncharacterized protein n=1 Tax=Patella caerulea TaxID=87958 RepID=A0AAN8J050_PATCE
MLTSIMFYPEKQFLEHLSEHLKLFELEPLRNISVDDVLCSSDRGKIRYVSGYVIAKIKHNLSRKIRNALFVSGKEDNLSTFQNQMDILNSLCSSYDKLKDVSSDVDSLGQIERKQNEREGLTNISDLTFQFFPN